MLAVDHKSSIMPSGRASGAGWNVETRYNPGVLVGNWQEERVMNEKKYFRPTTTYKVDLVKQPNGVLADRNAVPNTTGLTTSRPTIFGCRPMHKDENMITWYDEEYNRRPREGADKLPPLRKWSSSTMSWVPEKSDYPLRGAPTNYGLRESMKEHWSKNKNQSSLSARERFDTTYRWSYSYWSPDDYRGAGYSVSTNGHLPLLCYKPIECSWRPVDTSAAQDCSYSKTVSVHQNTVPSVLSQCNPSASQRVELPLIAI